MNHVDATLTDLIRRRYPCTQALHRVLVVLGNGMEWRGGLLVYRAPSSRTCAQTHLRSKVSEAQAEGYRELGFELPARRLTGICDAEDLRPRAAELARTPGPLGRDPYQPGTGLPLFEMPADADPHWRRAAHEIAEIVGPLWRNPSPRELAFQEAFGNDYTAQQRTTALDLLDQLLATPTP